MTDGAVRTEVRTQVHRATAAGVNPMMPEAVIGQLPIELTSFVGRQREIGEVKGLLSESRLVTLTGFGGAGKTRLALRLAADLQRAFVDGVWFVDLTQLHDPDQLVPEARYADALAEHVQATLGLPDLATGSPQARTGSPQARLVEHLASRQTLLVLDSCEHLMPASAILANALLIGCPELRILATSRDPLAIGGETTFAVPPLSVPDPGEGSGLAAVGRSEAVTLFLARAQAAMPAFQLTEENHLVVAELCRRLDGSPLAIELAAARTRALTPEQILDRLADRFALLDRGNRAGPKRQQTLRACVDWSFDLCSEPERMLWARLSVFGGEFELDAVEGICADEALPADELLELVTGLVDKSIVVCADGRFCHSGVARYRTPETIRDYGQDKLREAGEDAALRRRHHDWHQQLETRPSRVGQRSAA